jgi:hypothetical protein
VERTCSRTSRTSFGASCPPTDPVTSLCARRDPGSPTAFASLTTGRRCLGVVPADG